MYLFAEIQASWYLLLWEGPILVCSQLLSQNKVFCEKFETCNPVTWPALKIVKDDYDGNVCKAFIKEKKKERKKPSRTEYGHGFVPTY